MSVRRIYRYHCHILLKQSVQVAHSNQLSLFFSMDLPVKWVFFHNICNFCTPWHHEKWSVMAGSENDLGCQTLVNIIRMTEWQYDGPCKCAAVIHLHIVIWSVWHVGLYSVTLSDSARRFCIPLSYDCNKSI